MHLYKNICDAVIIGCGFAGASIAYHLTKMGFKDIIILEKENFLGVHSSGRNASLLRQTIENEFLCEMAIKGVRFLRNLPEDFPSPPQLLINGSLLLAEENDLERLDKINKTLWKKKGIDVKKLSYAEIIEMVPLIDGGCFYGGMFCKEDGYVDINSFLHGYVRGSQKEGAKLRLGVSALEIKTEGKKIIGVKTDEGFIRCKIVINAGGAWAQSIGKMAGATQIPLTPYRRHLFLSEEVKFSSPSQPFVWDISHRFYFRREGFSLLMSPCDETPHPPAIPSEDVKVRENLAEIIMNFYPSLSNIKIKRGWAGLRTFPPDRLFVLGFDPIIEGFFWAGGLGGHGVTASASIGEIGAKIICGKKVPDELEKAFSPQRFIEP